MSNCTAAVDRFILPVELEAMANRAAMSGGRSLNGSPEGFDADLASGELSGGGKEIDESAPVIAH